MHLFSVISANIADKLYTAETWILWAASLMDTMLPTPYDVIGLKFSEVGEMTLTNG